MLSKGFSESVPHLLTVDRFAKKGGELRYSAAAMKSVSEALEYCRFLLNADAEAEWRSAIVDALSILVGWSDSAE